ncbi:MAG: nicotinamide mononucleotide transporter [Bacteroidales bacterium]|nr:nicotinamide mononucleotide transporter [Bacteroidales bacterium]
MSTLDLIGAIIGLAYIVSEYRADRWFWPLSLLMSAFYAVLYLQSHYFANFAICVYNFAMSVYGILVWRGVVQSKSGGERPIGSCPRRLWLPIVAAVAALGALLSWSLDMLGESSQPLLDGFSSALSIVGMWMLSQKWWQEWICWLLVEPILIAMFLMAEPQPLYASAALYVVFEVFCVLGIIRWRRLSVGE